MKTYLIPCLIFFCLSCEQKEEAYPIVVDDQDSGVNWSEFDKLNCAAHRIEDAKPKKVIRFQKSAIVEQSLFGKVTLLGKRDSLFFNLEAFRVERNDTLRIANFGGRTIPKVGAKMILEETICKFFNK